MKTLNVQCINRVKLERANGGGFTIDVGYAWKSPRGQFEARRVVLHFGEMWWLRQIGVEAWQLFESWRTSITEEIDRIRKALKGET